MDAVRIASLAELVCKYARRRLDFEPLGREACSQAIMARLGPRDFVLAFHHMLRLNLVEIRDDGLEFTSIGARYADLLLELSSILRSEVGWGVEAVAAALNALTDWNATFKRGEEMVEYAETLIGELRRLESEAPGAYRWAVSLLVRYDFKSMEGPVELVRKIEELCLEGKG